MQNVILIVENIFEEIVITVTDEFSHCRTISTVETTPHKVNDEDSLKSSESEESLRRSDSED